MSAKRGIIAVCAALTASLMLSPALALDMNKSIKVPDGSETDGHSTINGSISVGSDSTVTGSLETVNGTIRIEENSRVRDAETVNGSVRIDSGVSVEDVSSVNDSVRLAENVTVDGEISVVNGKIDLGRGTSIRQSVSNVNGEMKIVGAEIGGDLSTVNGDVTLSDDAIVRGDLIVEKPGGWNNNSRPPKVVIGPGTRVEGMIRLEREVKLYISDTAVFGGVTGKMSLDDAVRFSGKRP